MPTTIQILTRANDLVHSLPIATTPEQKQIKRDALALQNLATALLKQQRALNAAKVAFAKHKKSERK